MCPNKMTTTCAHQRELIMFHQVMDTDLRDLTDVDEHSRDRIRAQFFYMLGLSRGCNCGYVQRFASHDSAMLGDISRRTLAGEDMSERDIGVLLETSTD